MKYGDTVSIPRKNSLKIDKNYLLIVKHVLEKILL